MLSPSLTQAESVFSKIYNKGLELILFENDHWFALFDSHPVNPGHVLIITKREVGEIADLNPAEAADFLVAISEVQRLLRNFPIEEHYRTEIAKAEQRVEQLRQSPEGKDADMERLSKQIDFFRYNIKLLEGFESSRPSSFNVMVNDGPVAGQTIPHVHVQVVPRFVGDVEDPRFGCRRMLESVRGDDRGDYKTARSN